MNDKFCLIFKLGVYVFQGIELKGIENNKSDLCVRIRILRIALRLVRGKKHGIYTNDFTSSAETFFVRHQSLRAHGQSPRTALTRHSPREETIPVRDVSHLQRHTRTNSPFQIV